MLDDRGLPHGYPFRPGLEITPHEAIGRLAQPGSRFVLFDCRTDAEWAIARVESSVHVPLDTLSERLEGGDLEEIVAGAEVAFLCHHGVRSLRAALLAREHGIPGAVSVAGGIELWSLAADPRVPRYERGPLGCRVLTS